MPPTHADADYRVRIFTPGGELPFAGHPTLGSAHAWLEHGGVPRRGDTIVQECGVGLVEVRRVDGMLSFVAPPLRRSGELDEAYVQRLCEACGLRREQIVAHQWVDNGPGWAVVQLASAEEVLALEPDLSKIPQAMLGFIGAYPAGSFYAFEMRTFAPGVGVAEDPVCGSMNASVGQWLTRIGAAPHSYLVSQGRRVGRAGEISITATEAGAAWVGGTTVTCFSGTAFTGSRSNTSIEPPLLPSS